MSRGGAVKSGCARAVEIFLEYETPKIVHIQSKKVGIVNRLIQFFIIAYIALYAIWWEKGYQVFESVVSSTTTKLKGVAVTNLTALNMSAPDLADGIRLWDVADYVIPPQENDAFFVMTNLIYTEHQTQGKCPEDLTMHDVRCSTDQDCPSGVPVTNGNGVRTGRCVASDRNSSVRVCEIYAWCPVEINKLFFGGQRPLLENTDMFTVLIKNNIEFPLFEQKRRNIFNSQNSTYLRSCHYNASHPVDRLCPIFRLSTIVSGAGVKNYSRIATQGGVIVINIKWECDFDFDPDWCLPSYSFSRLDSDADHIAKGANFRFATFYERDGTNHRDLFKVYGIRFIIKVSGFAGKFHIVPLLMNVGSGIGLLALATVVSDIIVFHFMEKGKYYQEKKFLVVNDEEQHAMPPPVQQVELRPTHGNGTGPSREDALLLRSS